MQRKKQPVLEGVRKRAQKSCDRCKRKKRACKRYDEKGEQIFDESYPCQNCINSNSECTVFIPRKKRNFFKISDPDLRQLKSLNLIVKAMFPENDPNNLDHLTKIADSLNISLPELGTNVNNEETDDMNSESVIDSIGLGSESNKFKNELSRPDSNLINNKIGLGGSHRIFNVLLELGATENGTANLLNTNNNTRIFPLNAKVGKHLQSSVILTKIPLEECDLYMQVFFKDFHQSYFIFDELVFRKRYALFTKYLKEKDFNSISHNFTNEETCAIYMVWILGRSCHLRNVLQSENTAPKVNLVNEPIIDEYINVVKLSLSNCFFSSTLHSVRVLYLMGLHSLIKMNTEAAWYFWVNCCLKCFGLGFNSSSIVSKYSEQEQEEIKIVWWSSFKIHLNNSAIIGRLPVISLSDVDVELPKLQSESDRFKEAYIYSIRLFKIMYLILKNREDLLKTNEPWKKENMISVLKIIGQLKTWKSEMVESLGSYTKPEGRFIIKLYLQYYYSSISLIIPYLVSYSLEDVTAKENIKSIVTILSYSIDSAIKVIDVILFSVGSGNFNGVLHYDLFYAYNSLMILLLYYSIIRTNKGNKNPLEIEMETELNINQAKTMQSIYQIRNVNKYHGHKSIGLNKFRVNINTLLECFKLNNDNDCREEIKQKKVSLINVANLPQSPPEIYRRQSVLFAKDKLFDFPILLSPPLGTVYDEHETLDVDEGFDNFIKFISRENDNLDKRFNDQVILEWNKNIDDVE